MHPDDVIAHFALPIGAVVVNGFFHFLDTGERRTFKEQASVVDEHDTILEITA